MVGGVPILHALTDLPLSVVSVLASKKNRHVESGQFLPGILEFLAFPPLIPLFVAAHLTFFMHLCELRQAP